MAKLNDMQQKAVDSKSSSTVVIAGAGSGKTTVITKRIAMLIQTNKALSEDILAITFTNKAANEMKERLKDELGPFASNMWIMTFHAFALRVIRFNLDKISHLDSNFNIVDDQDKKTIIKNIIKRLQLTDIIKVNQAIYAISDAKSRVSYIKEVSNLIDFDYNDIYKEYQDYLSKNNALDFDDILLICNELLDDENIQNYYINRFKYIHVDEFQDTSKVQFEMLEKIKNDTNNIFIVGDVDQSIYGWRGAQIDNLLNIEKTFKDTEVIKLEQNYRSSKNILKCANDLIENNIDRIDKTLWTEAAPGGKIKANRFLDAFKESDFVMQEVKMQHEMKKDLNEIAILYRANYLSKKIEEKLMQNHIPYKIYGGIRFYERMEIKDIIAYLRLIVNVNDNISFNRVINVPKRKVGEVTQTKYRNYAIENQISLFYAAKDLASKSVKEFVNIIESYQVKLLENFEEEFENLLLDIKYEQYLIDLDGPEKALERMENIKELKDAFLFAQNGGQSIVEYLNELILYSEADQDEQDGVVLATIHGVKGLEFDTVYMIGMSENIFPRVSRSFNLKEIEEERRVCYVGVTRARKKLVLTNYSFDFRGEYLDNSRFIKEMNIEVEEKEDKPQSGFIF